MRTIHQPYDIATFGMFRHMMMTGDFTPKVTLGAVVARHPTVGVGAVAGARGEFVTCDGKLIVSHGGSAPVTELEAEAAPLPATGTVPAWRTVTIKRDVAPEESENFLAPTAGTHGLDPDQSFPFEIRGTLAAIAMHVNAAPTDGPHGMGLPVAVTVERRTPSLAGAVAGLYVAPELVGIATHGGTRTHGHWVSPDRDATAHFDRWGLKAGALLLLPST